MHHYTLNTGHSRISPREEVYEHAIDFMESRIVPGVHELHENGWTLETDVSNATLAATLSFNAMPVVTMFVVAEGDDTESWNALESFYLKLTEGVAHRGLDWKSPVKPVSVPWCGVVVVQPVLAANEWIGDFERCLAWAFIESRRSDQQ